jgi:hypothetical protein
MQGSGGMADLPLVGVGGRGISARLDKRNKDKQKQQ